MPMNLLFNFECQFLLLKLNILFFKSSHLSLPGVSINVASNARTNLFTPNLFSTVINEFI